MEVVAAGVCKLMVPAKWDGGASLPNSDGVWEPAGVVSYHANFLAITKSI